MLNLWNIFKECLFTQKKKGEGNIVCIQIGFVAVLNKIWICLFVDIKVRDAEMSTITKSNSTTRRI